MEVKLLYERKAPLCVDDMVANSANPSTDIMVINYSRGHVGKTRQRKKAKVDFLALFVHSGGWNNRHVRNCATFVVILKSDNHRIPSFCEVNNNNYAILAAYAKVQLSQKCPYLVYSRPLFIRTYVGFVPMIICVLISLSGNNSLCNNWCQTGGWPP